MEPVSAMGTVIAKESYKIGNDGHDIEMSMVDLSMVDRQSVMDRLGS